MDEAQEPSRSTDEFHVIVSVLCVHFATIGLMVLASLMIGQRSETGWGLLYRAIAHWDAKHYLNIAAQGYTKDVEIVFFPLFPFLVRALSWFTGSVFAASVFLNVVAHTVAGYFLYRLVLLDYGRKLAYLALWCFLLFPSGFITVVPYTESLYLALLISAVFSFRTRRYWWAGVIGIAACATRITGVALILLFFVEWVSVMRGTVRFRAVLPALLLPGIGILLFLLLNYLLKGSPFFFMGVQSDVFHRNIASPHVGMFGAWAKMWGDRPESFTVGFANIAGGLLAWIVAVVTLWRVRVSYGVYCLALAALITFQSWWQSLLRYDLTFFPLFIIGAIVTERYSARIVWWATSLVLYALFAVQFARGWWSL